MGVFIFLCDISAIKMYIGVFFFCWGGGGRICISTILNKKKEGKTFIYNCLYVYYKTSLDIRYYSLMGLNRHGEIIYKIAFVFKQSYSIY